MAKHWSTFVAWITIAQARALDKMAQAHEKGDGMDLLMEVASCSRSKVGKMDRLTIQGHIDECFRRWGRDRAG